MLQGWNIGVVIPARNEEEHVAKVIEGLPPFVDIAVVVDDGSDDTTAVQAKNANTPCELAVLEGGGKGVGSAIDMGHQHLLGTFSSMFISVVMAGDGQMNPNDMDKRDVEIPADALMEQAEVEGVVVRLGDGRWMFFE